MIRPIVPSDPSRQWLAFGNLLRQLQNRAWFDPENGRPFIVARSLFVKFKNFLFNPEELLRDCFSKQKD